MTSIAENLRRLLARRGLTLVDLAQRANVELRTIKSLLNDSTSQPRARTLHQLAAALEADVDELFQNPSTLAHRHFDQQTNPVVTEVVEAQPQLFEGWTRADFDELYSRFGMGGALTVEGTRTAVQEMNRNREVFNKVALLLESGEREVLCGMIDLLYKKVVIAP